MDVIRIVGISIVGAVLFLIFKEQNPFVGIALSIATVIVILFFAFPEIERIFTYIKSFYRMASVDVPYLDIMLKIIGIVFLVQIGSDILKDAGFHAASTAVMMTGRVVCTGICLPVLTTLLKTILFILPG